MLTTLPDKFVGTLATSPSAINVGLHDAKYKSAKNNIERWRGAKGYRVGVFNTVSQLIMSGSVATYDVIYLYLRNTYSDKRTWSKLSPIE